MLVKLYNETPLHRDNFLKLVGKGFYDGLLFHRVINHFMIQGGDPDSRSAKPGQMLGEGGLGYTVPAEFNPLLFHKKGVLAAARLSDQENPEKASSSCQFYLVQGQVFDEAKLQMLKDRYGVSLTPEQIEAYKTIGGTPHLDGSYTVYGEVVEGLDVIDKIAAVPTDKMDRPLEDVKMSMKIIEVK
ncbi:MAG: peptidylprolyl isomerase [Bacteroidales bacterium]|nr:peptidylprolyl isomerase [Bacteroidales bacterium]